MLFLSLGASVRDGRLNERRKDGLSAREGERKKEQGARQRQKPSGCSVSKNSWLSSCFWSKTTLIQ